MKVRIRFSKKGALVYIGHLDVMRYFQKLFRRASIPVEYSAGFSPHQLLSFTPPLPLGMESDGEYADVELTGPVASEEALRRLRAASVPEIEIHSFKALPEKCENAMASVAASEYTVRFSASPDINLKEAVASFTAKKEVLILKKTKKSEKEIDLRPLVYSIGCCEECIRMLISSGSSDNIKPELVINAIIAPYGITVGRSDLIMRREDQYTSSDGSLISLDDVGAVII
ncbi:MAG: TIGR03936 family radical SAM-associated protein [Lachnospiraceae bacterium]|nr:TIGR03936 family radical SAM-associated protein [Lachnospiraceae bacterium]